MVTRIEILELEDKWINAGDVLPGEAGSLLNNTDDGTREVYVFECASDDSKTSIHKLLPGIDVGIGPYRAVNKENFSLEREIGKGDEPFEMSIKTDVSPEARQVRLTHI